LGVSRLLYGLATQNFFTETSHDLGRPWLATTNAFIGCMSMNMLISHEDSVKNVTRYPPIKSSHEIENIMCLDTTNSDGENVQPISAINQIMQFKALAEEYQIHSFLVQLDHLKNFDLSLDHVLVSIFKKTVI
jgi:hypothetical protein